MLTIWFGEDDDANLDNLAYILEGLQILKAAEVAKKMIVVSVIDDTSEWSLRLICIKISE